MSNIEEDDGPLGVEDWFRSDDIEYISIVMQEHKAVKVVSSLGRLGVVQFTDMNPGLTVFERRYVKEVNRISEIENKLNFLGSHFEKKGILPYKRPTVNDLLNRMELKGNDESGRTKHKGDDINILEQLVDQYEADLTELNNFEKNLRKEYNKKVELRCILSEARHYGTDNANSMTADARSSGDGESYSGEPDSMRFQFLAGVCKKGSRKVFERQIFWSTRGNCLTRFYDIEDELLDEDGSPCKKEVFIIFYQSKLIHDKIKKIADAFSANMYNIPDLSDVVAIDDASKAVFADIQEREKVLERNRQDIVVLLSEVAKFYEMWKMVCIREKAIYHTMNHFSSDVAGVLHAEGWVRCTKKMEVIKLVNEAHQENSGTSTNSTGSLSIGDSARISGVAQVSDVVPERWPTKNPPTFFKTNKFTQVFQTIVDTYGTARYQEANPAVLTTISFPFSFGVMFGDIGHGGLLFLFAAWVLWNEKWLMTFKGKDEMFDMVFGGRYMLILMGFFATYAGFMYNDFFAMGLGIWPTHWSEMENPPDGTSDMGFYPNQNIPVYPFGVDPTWHRAKNDLVYFNSVKMKMAVIFGVFQMTIGLIHRAQNAIYFGKKTSTPLWRNLDFIFEAVPMITFMMSLFGYMCFMIIYKWSLRWVWEYCGEDSQVKPPEGVVDYDKCDRINCCKPPMLITTLVNIALKVGDVPDDQNLYAGQGGVQTILILVAVICVPILLIPKPYFLIRAMKKHDTGPVIHHGEDHDLLEEGGQVSLIMNNNETNAAHDDDEHHNVSDIIIHQIIETIEFCLGCISNTASYLRLWALSLAHSQLSSVFLERALLSFVVTSGVGGIFATFIGYAVFAAITFAVLLLMDNLECFLHALRLSWVEYQSKFFAGDGLPFKPLHFKNLMDE